MPAKTTHSSSKLHLHGTVLGFNIGPKGHIDGALVETANGLAQLTFPKHTADSLARGMHPGSIVGFHVELETEAGGHPVYLVCDEESSASGQIVRLNYALHGAINGYHLEDGTFLHCKPDGAEQYDLHVGESVKATGHAAGGTRRGRAGGPHDHEDHAAGKAARRRDPGLGTAGPFKGRGPLHPRTFPRGGRRAPRWRGRAVAPPRAARREKPECRSCEFPHTRRAPPDCAKRLRNERAVGGKYDRRVEALGRHLVGPTRPRNAEASCEGLGGDVAWSCECGHRTTLALCDLGRRRR